MPIQQFTGRVSDSRQLTDKFHYMHIELIEPHRLEFIAGQYILLDVPGIEQKKSYSIASSPEMDHAIELLVDVAPQGAGTSYIASLKPGDMVQFRAPIGNFHVLTEAETGGGEKALAFVATGTGITPIRSMILDLLQQKRDLRKIVLYWGLRHEVDICWLDELAELQGTFPNFSLHFVLSQAGDEWPLCRGRVTDCLAIHPMLDSAGYYLCGSKSMIEDVSQLLLQRGVSQDQIHHEKFY